MKHSIEHEVWNEDKNQYRAILVHHRKSDDLRLHRRLLKLGFKYNGDKTYERIYEYVFQEAFSKQIGQVLGDVDRYNNCSRLTPQIWGRLWCNDKKDSHSIHVQLSKYGLTIERADYAL